MELSCTYVQGRRLRDVHAPTPRLVPVLGTYLANAAFYRTSSALAHERLGRELEAFGAPVRLRDACVLATLADYTHARELARLAAERGVTSPMPGQLALDVRSKLDVAIDNAVEGVVRQNYGLAVARHRADHAQDPDIQRVMAAIADEAEAHAELACEVALWLQTVLDPVEQALVEDALRHAAAALPREIDVEPEPVICESAGVPTRLDALTMWRRFAHLVSDVITPRFWEAAAALSPA